LDSLSPTTKNFSGIAPFYNIEVCNLTNKKIGEISRYFHNISVAAILLSDELNEGDRIHIRGATTDFEQTVRSMQIDRKPIEKGQKGQEIAIKVSERVREGDDVFLID